MEDSRPHFVTLGMFIIDEFSYADSDGNSLEKDTTAQIGGGGTYAAIGSRIWLPARKIGMIVDKGRDFPFQKDLEMYGDEMWLFRSQLTGTTRALNSYRGDLRNFQYLTPRIRISPRDLKDTKLERPAVLHFICSPTRAASIVAEIKEVDGWEPTVLYEPIPDRCVPEELPMLLEVLPYISVLSPNAEEALSLLSMPQPPNKTRIEEAARRFLVYGIGPKRQGSVIVRCGALGSYLLTVRNGRWIPAFWTSDDKDKVVDVTGAGNSFLGGLAAGLAFTGDLYKAAMYGTVSASFIIEQRGLPKISTGADGEEKWNGDSPDLRLRELSSRLP